MVLLRGKRCPLPAEPGMNKGIDEKSPLSAVSHGGAMNQGSAGVKHWTPGKTERVGPAPGVGGK